MREEALQAEGTAWAKDLGQKDRGKLQDLKEGHVVATVSWGGQDEVREEGGKSQTVFNHFYLEALRNH